MSETKVRIVLTILLVILIAFFAYGFYLFMLPSAAEKALGVFIMAVSFVFGMMNISALIDK